MFPAADPKGDPAMWAHSELKTWLEKRGLMADQKATREELLERVRANMRPPPRV
ncbi:hypothetical protein ABVK25_003114 [Lepraria finkii]|uniref:Uncharacterized protein n=1 Tax=Lepraria finkii TaxID=1340010 RepID=A0ABR4BFV2_9LECA